jgi:hypothetical protein
MFVLSHVIVIYACSSTSTCCVAESYEGAPTQTLQQAPRRQFNPFYQSS